MSLWVDKHRPRCLDQLRVHSKPARQLQKLLAGGDCPHLLFYGPSGAGKKTLCLATLREVGDLYLHPPLRPAPTRALTLSILSSFAALRAVGGEASHGAEDLADPGGSPSPLPHLPPWTRSDNPPPLLSFGLSPLRQLPSRKIEVELATVSSNYHLEVSPADAGRRDVHVVQEIIKEMAKTRSSTSVFQQQQQQQEQEQETSLVKPAKCAYKVLVINQVDKLSSHAQHALRRTLEKYSATCRVIFTCTNLSKVMGPVRSRCVCVRVKAPSTEEISELVSEVAGKERKEVPRGLANKIAASSERSMRRALLMLETASLGKLDESQELQVSRDLSLPPRATLTGGC